MSSSCLACPVLMRSRWRFSASEISSLRRVSPAATCSSWRRWASAMTPAASALPAGALLGLGQARLGVGDLGVEVVELGLGVAEGLGVDRGLRGRLGPLGLGPGPLDALLGGALGVVGLGLGLGGAVLGGLERALGVLDLGRQPAELRVVTGSAD